MTKQELKEIIAEEKAMYNKSNYSFRRFVHQKRYMIWKYLACFRWSQYYRDQITESAGFRRLYGKVAYRVVLRRKNILGEKCGVEITNNSQVGRRLSIWHSGVVIAARLGDDCSLRGNCVIGNKELVKSSGRPTVGNGVEIGFGAAITGSINIADHCIIGTNAVVTKDFPVPGTVIVGIPGRALK